MTDQIALNRGATTVTLNGPEWGYTSEIHLAMLLGTGGPLSNGEYHWRDNGIDYDNRFCEMNLVLNSTQQEDLQDFISTQAQGRGATFQLHVPNGIFPFGPDLGDNRRFQVHLASFTFNGANRSPYMTFNSSLRLFLVSSPSYDVQDIVDTSKAIEIGDIDGFRYPQEMYQPKTNYAVYPGFTYGGGASSIDLSSDGDSWTSEFTVKEHETRTARLLYYLQNTARGSTFSMTAQKNSFVFGRDNCDDRHNEGGGVYTVILTHNVIRCTHPRYNEWLVNLGVSYRSHAGLPGK